MSAGARKKQKSSSKRKKTKAKRKYQENYFGGRRESLDKSRMPRRYNTSRTRDRSPWESLSATKIEKIKENEEKMDNSYNSLQENREKISIYLDQYIARCDNDQADVIVADERINKLSKEIYESLQKLEKKTAERDALVSMLDEELSYLEERNPSARTNVQNDEGLTEWIRTTCDKCEELGIEIEALRNDINDKKRKANEINPVEAKKNKLFAIVTLDDLKNLSPFKTVSDPSAP